MGKRMLSSQKKEKKGIPTWSSGEPLERFSEIGWSRMARMQGNPGTQVNHWITQLTGALFMLWSLYRQPTHPNSISTRATQSLSVSWGPPWEIWMQSSLKIIVLIKGDFTGEHQGSWEVGSVRSISKGRELPSYVPNDGWRAEGLYTERWRDW